MLLLDHFQPPLSEHRHWEAFHASWANSLAWALNQRLPSQRYFAEAEVHVGSRVEVDVTTFDSQDESRASQRDGGTATMAAAPRTWSPPAANMSLPAIFPDSIEVLIYNTEAGPTLVAAIELVSPGNKDRNEFRRAFAAKCATYLRTGIGLMILDIVTSRTANMHNELVRLIGAGDRCLLSEEKLYATAYHPRRVPGSERIDVWNFNLAVGQPLSLLPLPLDKNQFVPLDLGAAYEEACQRGRLASP